MPLISAQTLTLKSPSALSLPSHSSIFAPSQSPSFSHPNNLHSPSLFCSPKSTTQYGSRRLVVSGASTNTSALDFSPSIGEVLGDINIFTAAGDSVQFKDLWDLNKGVAVVAILRHFGCPCCCVKMISVGVGSPDKALILTERLPFPMDSLYADPDRKVINFIKKFWPDHKAYDVLGLYYGLGQTFFNPASARVFSRFEALQKAVKNHTIEATPDDRSSVLQQGGMFVFKGKQLLYARKDKRSGDHAPLDDILDVCCKVPVS